MFQKLFKDHYLDKCIKNIHNIKSEKTKDQIKNKHIIIKKDMKNINSIKKEVKNIGLNQYLNQDLDLDPETN